MLKGNKGEWSEVYTLLKLIGDKVVYGGDKDLNQIPNLFYPILKILRDDSSGHFNYSINDDIVFINGMGIEERVPIQEFHDFASLLLAKIKEAKGASFRVTELEEFLGHIKCTSLRANSTTKEDIRIIIHDQKTGMQPLLGFSIKSQLGGASTLLNAGKTTNFIYKITNTNLSKQRIEEINTINSRSKVKDRLAEIIMNNGIIEFDRIEREIFNNNLVLIDSLLPQLMGELLLDFYTSKRSSIKDLTDFIEQENPLHYNVSNQHKFYEYKIKKLMTESALGMMPSKVWSGTYNATGGYLVVKEDGAILSYHIYNRNEFEDYLFNNTKLETPSTSKYDFAKIYEEDGALFIKLNLQIRFKK
jgi:type II restriction enzyme